MNPKVNCVDLEEVKKELKNCPKIVRDYVKSLENNNQRWMEINNNALLKIKELSKK